MRDPLSMIETAIQKIKIDLGKLGKMRPGSLSIQYRDRRNRTGPYYQLSYTRGGRSHTERVHPDYLIQVGKEISNFKRFRQLTEQWVNLSLMASKLRMKDRKKVPQKGSIHAGMDLLIVPPPKRRRSISRSE